MQTRYDMVIIGGGIHGVGAAQAAAAAGYQVLLLEQRELAFGTSSRSSKLIHGGLRYLESAQLGVVRECLRERALLLKLAPDLVRLIPFRIPVYRDTSRRPWQIRAGLSLYALLAELRRDGRFCTLPRREWGELDGITTEDLQQVFQYQDAQTDDVLLTRAVMQSAQQLGAELMTDCEFISAELGGDSCTVHYRQAEREGWVEARVLINAGGPWVNEVLSRITPQPTSLAMELVQGSHIVVAGELRQGIYYMEAPADRRAVFVMPWQGQMLVGTTETVYQGDPAAVHPLVQEQQYLLETLGHYFPAYRDTGIGDLVDSFAGLRVLPSKDDSPFRRSRETIFHTDRHPHPRVLSIYGGKLTAYRATSEKVIARLAGSLPARRAIADTRQLPLTPPDD